MKDLYKSVWRRYKIQGRIWVSVHFCASAGHELPLLYYAICLNVLVLKEVPKSRWYQKWVYISSVKEFRIHYWGMITNAHNLRVFQYSERLCRSHQRTVDMVVLPLFLCLYNVHHHFERAHFLQCKGHMNDSAKYVACFEFSYANVFFDNFQLLVPAIFDSVVHFGASRRELKRSFIRGLGLNSCFASASCLLQSNI